MGLNSPKHLLWFVARIHKDFGRDHSSKGQECLDEFCITKLLRQVIDEEVSLRGLEEQLQADQGGVLSPAPPGFDLQTPVPHLLLLLGQG